MVNEKGETSVRIVLHQDFEMVATKSGIKIGSSVVTWGWLAQAKADLDKFDANKDVKVPLSPPKLDEEIKVKKTAPITPKVKRPAKPKQTDGMILSSKPKTITKPKVQARVSNATS